MRLESVRQFVVISTVTPGRYPLSPPGGASGPQTDARPLAEAQQQHGAGGTRPKRM